MQIIITMITLSMLLWGFFCKAEKRIESNLTEENREGAGSGILSNAGDDVIINALTGDNKIVFVQNTVIEYNGGVDGNDKIYGFDETSTLKITNLLYNRERFRCCC